uniref:cx9C motif-containing protein 4 isoform X2 n=1 Tax=Myxine glutinosa TaxID=7769 RepID=UPI00358DF959
MFLYGYVHKERSMQKASMRHSKVPTRTLSQHFLVSSLAFRSFTTTTEVGDPVSLSPHKKLWTDSEEIWRRENNFQQDRCGRAINEMIRCCAKLSQPSICCSGFRRELPSPSADTPPPTAPDSSFEQAHDKETLNKPTTRRAEGHKTYTL